MASLTKRKKRLPGVKVDPAPPTEEQLRKVEETLFEAPPEVDVSALPKHLQRKHELHRQYGLPLKDIFVDPKNGVELFRSPDSNAWTYGAPIIEKRDDDDDGNEDI